MESQVIFRNYQEQQAADHESIQDFARTSLDHVVKDIGSGGERAFAGFNTTKTAQVEIQISAGRFFDVNGEVFALDAVTTQSMITYLASASKKYITISAYGNEVETNTQERDFLINVDTGATEPRAVDMTRSRVAVLAFTQSGESADPQAPAVPVGHVKIADVLVDSLQVVSVTMNAAGRIASTRELDHRVDVEEAFTSRIGPRVDSLASDLADLKNQIGQQARRTSLANVYLDLARVKAALRFPQEASQYDADFYLDRTKSDYNDALLQGYDAKVEEGVRFSDANADEFEIGLFSNNDPNAALSNGVLLPKFAHEVKFTTGVKSSTLGIAQYGFQDITMQQGYMSRTRLRYGGAFYQCSNGAQWNTPGQPTDLTNLYDLTSSQFTAVSSIVYDGGLAWNHEYYRADTWWLDSWKDPFMFAVTTGYNISGAMVAQSWLQSNDMWATKFGVWIDVKAANEDIHFAICELTSGVPNLERTVMKTVLGQANIVIGWNDVAMPYTFLQKGKRYALVAVSNANHQFGIADGQGFLNGTFFYSTDGAFFLGDLTKDMMMRIWGARFTATQVTIEFEPINLDGGFRNVDILAEMWVPDSCQFFWEMRPSGTGDWQPLVNDAGAVLASAPALAQFRGRFVGTADVAPALTLDGSRVNVSRPKLALKHVTPNFHLSAPSTEIHVLVTLEHFDDTPHDHALTLKTGVTHNVTETPDTTVTTLLDADAKRYKREYTFNIGAAISDFIIIQTGATNNANNTYHVAERDFYSV